MSSTATEHEQTAFVSNGLYSLSQNPKFSLPIDAPALLAKLIAISAARPPLRLTDQSRFAAILDSLARNWEHGSLTIHRDAASGVLSMLDIHLGADARPHLARKRKRAVRDEDADSATGDPNDEPDSTGDDDGSANDVSLSPALNQSRELREVYALLQKSTAKGRLLAEQFRSTNAFEPVCPHITKDDCAKARARLSSLTGSSEGLPSASKPTICSLVHFRAIIRPHTDPSLGHCSYLNTCYSEPTYALSPSIPPPPSAPRPPGTMSTPVSLPSGLGAGGRGKEKAPCRYLHFEIDWDEGDGPAPTHAAPNPDVTKAYAQRESKRESKDVAVVKGKPFKIGIGLGPTGKETTLLPPQWINCDLRRFDYSVLGKFHVIMADPPWDIHMSVRRRFLPATDAGGAF
jgi:mRNA m6A methyltransferase catalytic subunit